MALENLSKIDYFIDCSSMIKTVDLQRLNPFPMIVSYTGTPFTKGQNPRR